MTEPTHAAAYEAPKVWELGRVEDLTQMPTPPGKSGRTHDGSRFLSNFSCTGPGGGNCGTR